MRNLILIVVAILSICLPAEASAQAGWQETRYKLGSDVSAGDRAKIHVKAIFDADVTIISSDAKQIESKLFSHKEEIFEQTILEKSDGAIGATGKKLIAEVRCISSWEKLSQTQAAGTKTPIDGKSFRLDLDLSAVPAQAGDKKRKVTALDNVNIEDVFLRHVGSWIVINELLPSGEVKIGEEWEAKLRDVVDVRINKKPLEFSAMCKLKEVRSDGVAVISLDSANRQSGQTKFDLELEGELLFDYIKSRPIKLTFKFKLEMTDEVFDTFTDIKTGLEKKVKAGDIKLKTKEASSEIRFEYE